MSALLLNTSFTAADLGQRAPGAKANDQSLDPQADPSNKPNLRGDAPTLPNATRPGDLVTFSPEAQEAGTPNDPGAEQTQDATAPTGKDGEPLSEEEQQQVEDLEARDREVRQHEQAHKAAAGSHATSGPTYSYQEGPDGKRYAIGGSVGIDVSPEATPEETIAKMQVVRRAALAPAEPSGQDRKVAAQAARTEQQARAELAQQRNQSTENGNDEQSAGNGLQSSTGASTQGANTDKLEAYKPITLPTFEAVG